MKLLKFSMQIETDGGEIVEFNDPGNAELRNVEIVTNGALQYGIVTHAGLVNLSLGRKPANFNYNASTFITLYTDF